MLISPFDLTYLPHIGWLAHEVNDDVGFPARGLV